MAFQLFSPAFANGGWIPALHTCQGADLSPPLEWSGEPDGTRSFALIVDDPDAPTGTWNHWLLWNIPSKIHSLAQGFKPGTVGVSGRNDFGRAGAFAIAQVQFTRRDRGGQRHQAAVLERAGLHHLVIEILDLLEAEIVDIDGRPRHRIAAQTTCQ